MKSFFLTFLIACLTTSAFAFDSSAIRKKQEDISKQQADISKQQAEKASAEAAAKQAAIEEKEKKDYEKTVAENGAGWMQTIFAAFLRRENASNDIGVSRILELLNSKDGRSGGQNSRSVTAQMEGLLIRFPGSTAEAQSGTGKIVIGNKKYEIVDRKLFKLEEDAANGLHYTTTWDDATHITTHKASDGTSSIISKINMKEPKKSKIVDVVLPTNAQPAFAQIFAKAGLPFTEKAVVSMIEGYYVDKLMRSGQTLQSFIDGILTDIDVRDQLFQYCQKIAVSKK